MTAPQRLVCHFLEETLWEVIKCSLPEIFQNRKNTRAKTKPACVPATGVLKEHTIKCFFPDPFQFQLLTILYRNMKNYSDLSGWQASKDMGYFSKYKVKITHDLYKTRKLGRILKCLGPVASVDQLCEGYHYTSQVFPFS